jgi:hypothetical protein
MVDDSVAYALVAATGFFLAVAFGLLYRYRQASQRLNESTDLGRDLWEALDQRMKKQDQRIIDLMARVEVLQARAMSAAPAPPPMAFPTPSPSVQAPPPPAPKPTGQASEIVAPESRPVTVSQPATAEQTTSQPITEMKPQFRPAPASLPASTLPKPLKLDNTSRTALELLRDKPLTTEELWTRLKKGREHTSRVMKNLYERGLVTRDDANKPYTYQLTDEGRRFLSVG